MKDIVSGFLDDWRRERPELDSRAMQICSLFGRHFFANPDLPRRLAEDLPLAP